MDFFGALRHGVSDFAFHRGGKERTMHMKRLVAATFAALSMFGLGAEALAQRGGGSTTVVLIDRQKVVTESAAFKSIQSQLTTVRNQVQADLEKREAALTQGLKALQDTRDTMGKDDFQKRAAALTRQELELLADQEIANRELTIAQNTAIAKLEDPLKAAVENVAKKRKGAIVLETSLVVYPGDAPDVTDEVLKELDRALGSVQVVKPTTSAEDRAKVIAAIEQQIALQQMEAVGRQQVMALGQQSLQAAAKKQ